MSGTIDHPQSPLFEQASLSKSISGGASAVPQCSGWLSQLPANSNVCGVRLFGDVPVIHPSLGSHVAAEVEVHNFAWVLQTVSPFEIEA